MVLTWSGVDDGDADEGHDEDGAKRLHVDDHTAIIFSLDQCTLSLHR